MCCVLKAEEETSTITQAVCGPYAFGLAREYIRKQRVLYIPLVPRKLTSSQL